MELVEVFAYSEGLVSGLKLHGFGWKHTSTLDEEQVYDGAWWIGPLDIPGAVAKARSWA